MHSLADAGSRLWRRLGVLPGRPRGPGAWFPCWSACWWWPGRPPAWCWPRSGGKPAAAARADPADPADQPAPAKITGPVVPMLGGRRRRGKPIAVPVARASATGEHHRPAGRLRPGRPAARPEAGGPAGGRAVLAVRARSWPRWPGSPGSPAPSRSRPPRSRSTARSRRCSAWTRPRSAATPRGPRPPRASSGRAWPTAASRSPTPWAPWTSCRSAARSPCPAAQPAEAAGGGVRHGGHRRGRRGGVRFGRPLAGMPARNAIVVSAPPDQRGLARGQDQGRAAAGARRSSRWSPRDAAGRPGPGRDHPRHRGRRRRA